jgi:hypothetical protein
MAISNSTIDATNKVVYQSIGENAITTIIICNTELFDPQNPTANEAALFLYAVPAVEVSGTTTLAKHTLINGLPIPAGETVSLDQEKIVLSTGDIIIAKSSSSNKLVVTLSTLAV